MFVKEKKASAETKKGNINKKRNRNRKESCTPNPTIKEI